MDENARHLLLLRHAKSRWDEPGKSDFERGLAPRGNDAARRIGGWLARCAEPPGRVLCSTAERARATWNLVSERWGVNPQRKDLKSLYLASPGTIASIIARQPAELRSLLVVGHNPGLHRFALGLLGERAPPELEAKLPTGALLVLRLRQPGWADIRQPELIHLVLPRRLEEPD